LNQIQICFENHLKNGFEKWEKKKKRDFSSWAVSLSTVAAGPCSPRGPSPLPRRLLLLLGRAEPSRPARLARDRSPPLCVADRWDPFVSDCLPFPFFFLQLPNRELTFPSSPIRFGGSISLPSIDSDAFGL
jgi:hypothetical protein